jgi:aryl-alcohol dehydrogenase-like predicted oxidoreductase
MKKSVEDSLNVLGVPVIDTLFLHEPSVIKEDDADRIIETLISLKQMGYAKRLGVGGNSPDWFKKYITPDVFEVVMEYNRLNACSLDALHTSLPDCESKGIEFYVASPLHMGLLGSRFDSLTANPPAWLDKNVIETAKRVKAIADRYGLSLPSLAHRFLLSLSHDFKIVIGAVDSYQLQQSIDDFAEGPLSCELFDEIRALINVNA